jgi:hypothetical protein
MMEVAGGSSAIDEELKMFQGWRKWSSYICAFLVLSIARCVPSPSAPMRNFTTTDLLLDPSLLPSDWYLETEATEYSADDMWFRNNLGGSSISLVKCDDESSVQCCSYISSVDHDIARFRNARDAARAYRDHDFTHDTKGEYGTTWKVIADFTYQSSIADQFRVVCGTTHNVSNIGASCVIEAQYTEFLSVILYSDISGEETLSNLEIIAKAVDGRMAYYLGEEQQ